MLRSKEDHGVTGELGYGLAEKRTSMEGETSRATERKEEKKSPKDAEKKEQANSGCKEKGKGKLLKTASRRKE